MRVVALICFRFRAAVLVGDFVFLEQFGHFFGDHVAIIGDGDDRELFSRLGLLFRRRLVGLFGCVSHRVTIHQGHWGVLSYSNASSDDFSGNCRLHPRQVTKYTASRTDSVARKSRLTPRWLQAVQEISFR